MFLDNRCSVGYVCQLSLVNTATFTRSLTVGMHGDDVKALQVFLNSKGFKLASSGPGSPGNETTKFGALTRDALAKFQISVGIKPPAGFFGLITRGYLKKH